MKHDERASRFLELLRPIERDLEMYCRRMVWRSDDTPDALQNAVLRAFRAFDRYHEDASFRAWMFKILTNEIFAINRKRGRIAQFEMPVESEQLDALGALEQATEYTDWLLSPDSLVEALDEDLVAALKALPDEIARTLDSKLDLVAFAYRPGEPAFSAQGARRCKIDGTPIAWIFGRYQDAPVSLLVFKKEELARFPVTKQKLEAGETVFCCKAGRYQFAVRLLDDHVVCAIGRPSMAELERLVRSVSKPT